MEAFFVYSKMKHLIFPVFLLAACATKPDKVDEPPVRRPNMIVIMADDMGYSDLGAYGSEIETPNLDGLAQNGMRFTRFYNAARCCPTRASLLTGMYPHKAGMGAMVSSVKSPLTSGPYQGYLSDSAVTVAERLKQAGYNTYMSGKWHVGERPEHWPRQRGFDRYFGLISGASSYYEILKNQKRVRQMALDDTAWEPPEEGFYMTDAITDYAIKYIRENNAGEPYFLYIAYTAPHWPLHALPEDIAKYKGRYDAGWDSIRLQRFQNMQKLGLADANQQLPGRAITVPEWERQADREDWARRMEVYAAMIDRMDQGIGNIIDAIRARGDLDNTLILFLSDNGGSSESVTSRGLHNSSIPIGARGSYAAYREPWAHVSNTPLKKYKQWVHEGGIATPMIAHWPAVIAPGSFEKTPAHVIDIMATCLDIAGIANPESTQTPSDKTPDGNSLLPVFKNEDFNRSQPIYWEHLGNKAIMVNNWKLVAAKDGPWELYNLDNDRSEQKDLSSEMKTKVDSLNDLYVKWAREVGVR